MQVKNHSLAALLVSTAIALSVSGCATAPKPNAEPATAPAPNHQQPTTAQPTPQPAGDQAAPAGKEPVENVVLRWEAGIEAYLLVYGQANVPDLHLELRTDSKQFGQADVQVKDGAYLATLADPGPGVAADLIISTVEPDAKEITRIAVPQDRWVGAAWSQNFAKVNARQLDPQTVLVSGEARVFEGVFAVQIRVDGQVVGEKQVKVAEGAPAFSPFEEKITVQAPLPQEGVEAYFLTESPKDGSNRVELYTQVLWGK